MQVTGSNSENDKKILSVRLRQGGLSFYLADDEGTMQYGIDFRKEASPAGQIARMTARLRPDFDLVQVFADTDRTLFVPADLLAEADPIPEGYICEVSSAGLDRALRKPEHFEKCLGRQVDVKLYRPQAGSKEYTGALTGYQDGDVLVDDRRFEKKDVAQVRLHVSF